MNDWPMPLESLRACFEGVIPASIATCSPEGIPNVSYISYVHYVDPTHVALSHQFFNKTRANLESNPFATVFVIDPDTSACFRLRLRHDHSETEGDLFETMALRIQAIASLSSMEGVFRLLAAEVFEVEDVEAIEGATRPDGPPPAIIPRPGADRRLVDICGLRLLSDRINRAGDLDGVLDGALEVLEGIFGFEHSTLLLPDEPGERLYAIAVHGYGTEGIGAEVRVGEGVIGLAARAKKLLRVPRIDRDVRYAQAVREQTNGAHEEIPLPALQGVVTQVAIPLLVAEELVGVLAVESSRALVLTDAQEAFLGILANHIALAVARMHQRSETAGERHPLPSSPAPVPPTGTRHRTFTFYRADDCVFVDGAYLVRNVPGRILWKLLKARVREGRTEFSNRELRLDPTMGLPPVRDNLESRLILLRKRLAAKCPDLRIVPAGRGRFTFEVACEVDLTEREDTSDSGSR